MRDVKFRNSKEVQTVINSREKPLFNASYVRKYIIGCIPGEKVIAVINRKPRLWKVSVHELASLNEQSVEFYNDSLAEAMRDGGCAVIRQLIESGKENVYHLELGCRGYRLTTAEDAKIHFNFNKLEYLLPYDKEISFCGIREIEKNQFEPVT